MTARRFKQVDVFTSRALSGNPVAVVLDAEGLDDDAMQRFAAWTNLAETTFVLPSERADYRLRIFTPRSELPFAGHPTIGSAHAVLEAGLVSPRDGALTQDCGAGLVPLRVEEGRITARAPRIELLRDVAFDVAEVSALVGVEVQETPPPQAIDVGPVWLIARLADAEAVSRAAPAMADIESFSRDRGLTGITVFGIDSTSGAEARVRLRAFAPAVGVPEDPVTGSSNIAIGAYLGATGLLARTGSTYVASQGREIGRDGRVSVRVAGGAVEIGGEAVTVIEGELRI